MNISQYLDDYVYSIPNTNLAMIVSLLFIGLIIVRICVLFSYFKANSHRNQQRVRQQDPSHDCPICLEQIQHPVMGKCKHMYCGDCMMVKLLDSQKEIVIICPLCRYQIRQVYSCFQQKEQTPLGNQILARIRDYNRYYFIRNIRILFNRLSLSVNEIIIIFLISSVLSFFTTLALTSEQVVGQFKF